MFGLADYKTWLHIVKHNKTFTILLTIYPKSFYIHLTLNHSINKTRKHNTLSLFQLQTHLYGDAHKSVVGAQQKEVEVPHKHQEDRLEETKDDKKIAEDENSKDDVEEEDEDHLHGAETEDELQGQRDGQDRTENKDTKDDEEKDAAIEHQHTDLPISAPRRSSKLRKPPNRLGDYVSKVMSPRPFDNRLHALQELMNSGIINNLDSETAHRLIAAIMNG